MAVKYIEMCDDAAKTNCSLVAIEEESLVSPFTFDADVHGIAFNGMLLMFAIGFGIGIILNVIKKLRT